MFKLLLFVVLYFAVFQCNSLIADEIPAVQSNWQSCSADLQSPQTATEVRVFVPLCPPINGTETRCQLTKGKTATIIIQFNTTVAIPALERIIVAQVPATAETKVTVPYGPAVSPCSNATLVSTTGSGCSAADGVEANSTYTYTASFDVLNSFPTVTDIETRFILRQAVGNHTKLRLYRKHPGATLLCVYIPHIDVVD